MDDAVTLSENLCLVRVRLQVVAFDCGDVKNGLTSISRRSRVNESGIGGKGPLPVNADPIFVIRSGLCDVPIRLTSRVCLRLRQACCE